MGVGGGVRIGRRDWNTPKTGSAPKHTFLNSGNDKQKL